MPSTNTPISSSASRATAPWPLSDDSSGSFATSSVETSSSDPYGANGGSVDTGRIDERSDPYGASGGSVDTERGDPYGGASGAVDARGSDSYEASAPVSLRAATDRYEPDALLPPIESALSSLERVRTSLRGGEEDGAHSPYGAGGSRAIEVTGSQAAWRQPSRFGSTLKMSAEPVSVYLKEIRLNESFDTHWPFFGDDINEVRLLGVAWDLSGRPPYIFAPDHGSGPYFRVRPHENVTFIGDGLQVWPNSHVTGGLNVRILLVESDAKERAAGEEGAEVAKAITDSGLGVALKEGAGSAAGPAGHVAIEAAVAALDAALTKLANNGDDHIALFDGTYGAEFLDRQGPNTVEKYDRPGASIQLRLVKGDAPVDEPERAAVRNAAFAGGVVGADRGADLGSSGVRARASSEVPANVSPTLFGRGPFRRSALTGEISSMPRRTVVPNGPARAVAPAPSETETSPGGRASRPLPAGIPPGPSIPRGPEIPPFPVP